MIARPLRFFGHAALLLWVGLLPLQTRFFLHQATLAGGMWEYGALSFYFSDTLLLIAGAAMFAEQWRSGTKDRLSRHARELLVATAALVVVVTLSSVTANDVGVALGVAARFVFGFFAAWLIAKSRLSIGAFAVAITASAALEAVVVLIQFAVQSIPASTIFGLAAHAPAVAGDAVVETTIGRFLRSYGTLPHPNMAAGWLALGLLFCSGLVIRSRDKIERALLLAAFCIMMAGLVFTFSRAGLLGWLVVFLVFLLGVLLRERRDAHRHVFFFLHRKGELSIGLKAMKLVSVTVLLLGVLLWIFGPLVRGRADVAGRIERISISERAAQYSEARTLFVRHWFLGVGVGNYTKALHDEVDAGRQVWGYQPVHNVFVLAAVELGVFGFLILLIAIILFVRALWQEHRRCWDHPASNGVPWAAVIGLALFLLALLGTMDHYLWSLPFGIMVTWALLGLALKSIAVHEE